MSRRSSHLVIAAGVLALAVAAATGVAAIAPSGADESALALSASLSSRKLTVMRGGEVVKVYDVAVGSERHPTPTGSFMIHRIVWNPAWVPPDRKWAKGKTAQGPGDPENPMRVVKIFFQEPDFFIHGTFALGSLGQAASHG